MRELGFILLIFISVYSFSQAGKNISTVDWDGYSQIRATSNFDDNTSFMLRRMKLWVKSKPNFSKHWSYKLQARITSLQQQKLFLQDVKIGYKTGHFSLDIGQFVPQYSLQRFQPDYKIAPIERAKAINILIPDGTIGVRDIGLQANFETKNKLLSTHLGVFNGYGIKEYRYNNQGYMLTHKSELNIPIKNNKIKIGYSLQYRYADNLQIEFILPDSILFSGHDFRYNLFALFKSKLFVFQAEFLNANLSNSQAYGYYLLTAVNINKNQIVFSFDNYKDLIPETSDNPYYRLGYNYFVKANKIKLSFDNYFQINNNNIDKYFVSIQLQLFFKQV